jgi:hypothetical protein
MSAAPNSIRCYVEDECGDRFLVTMAGLDYEARFREHARWWIKTGHKQVPKRRDGSARRMPAGQCRVVIEPYHDASAKH